MSDALNTIDTLLQATSPRLLAPANAAIILDTTIPVFHVNTSGVSDPTSITFTAKLIAMEGTVTFSSSGCTLTSISGNTAVLLPANMAGATATVTASLTYRGTAFSSTVSLSKVVDGAGGAAGLNVATVALYQRALTATAPAVPSGSVTYTFATGAATGIGSWSSTIPASTGGPFLFATLATAAATTATDTIATGEWSTPRTVARDGVNGGIISDDPYILDAAAWTIPSGVSILTGTTATGSVTSNHFDNSATLDAIVMSARAFPIDPLRTYDLTANLYAATGNNRYMWVLVEFYDATGAHVSTGWGGTYSGYTFGNLPTPTGQFNRCGGRFGATNSSRLIPSNVRSGRIGVFMQYSGSGSGTVEQAFQDLRLIDVTDAANAQVDATAALASLTAIFADNVLSRDEKTDLIQRWTAADAEFPVISAQATALSVPTTAYLAAMVALNAYLAALSPGWTDTTQNTTIVRADANAAWNGYYAAKVAILNAITAQAATGGVSLVAHGNTSGFTITGNSFTRVGGTVWDVGAYSRDGHTGGSWCSATIAPSSEIMFGLNSASDLASDAGYATIDYAWYCPAASNNMRIYLSAGGSSVDQGAYGGTNTGAEVFGVSSDGEYVKFTKDGVVILAIAAANSANKYSFDSSVVNGTLRNIRFGAMPSIAAGVAAAAAASAAQIDATAALTSLTAIFADNILSRDEKADLKQRGNAIDAEEPLIVAQATTLSVSSTAYVTAFTALGTYLASLSPAWDDTTQNTTIVRTTANTKWTDYYTAKVNLLNAIAAKIQVNAAAAQADATAALADINNVLSATALSTLNPTGGSNTYRTLGTRTASPSGGSGTYSYSWSITYVDVNDRGGYMDLVNPNSATVTVKSYAFDSQVVGRLICLITDSKNKALAIDCTAIGTHGTQP